MFHHAEGSKYFGRLILSEAKCVFIIGSLFNHYKWLMVFDCLESSLDHRRFKPFDINLYEIDLWYFEAVYCSHCDRANCDVFGINGFLAFNMGGLPMFGV